MFKSLSFNKRLSIYLLLIFVVFSFLIMLMQYNREKDFRKRHLENTLDNITELTNNFLINNDLVRRGAIEQVDSLIQIIPRSNIRISIIDNRGVVLYDNEVEDVTTMENHLKRPELQLSLRSDYGSNIRASSTTGNEYFYYSKYFGDYYIRTAALYDLSVKDFLKAKKFFILQLLFLCSLIIVALLLTTNRLTRTIKRLKDFALAISKGQSVENISFPSGELGVVSGEIVKIYNELNEAKETIDLEKNKLYNHLHAINEGIALFSSKKEKLLTNNHFIHFLNQISEKTSISANEVFNVSEFTPIVSFIDHILNLDEEINAIQLPKFTTEIHKDSKYYEVTCIFFQDKSFEVMIKDTTKLEKRKILKQQMTSNISHELKTPAASILGYLETLVKNKMDGDQRKHFVEKAYAQANRLSELLEDLSTLNHMEETENNYVFEKLNLVKLIQDVEDTLQLKLEENKVKVNTKLPDKLMIKGNKSLLFSIFYNLYDNAIKYGGEEVQIFLDNYLDENNFLHFSFANTGIEIEEKHMARIFERFYRVDRGRSRKTGGSGLGLAIVKNAVQVHGGQITAGRYKNGGVEFLFSLSKK